MRRGQHRALLKHEQGSLLGTIKARFEELARSTQDWSDAWLLVFRAPSRQAPKPSVAIDLLSANATNFSATRADQKLKLQNVRRFKRKGIGLEPLPDQLDFLNGQDSIAGDAGIIGLKSDGRVGRNEILSQTPAEHGADHLPALFSFAPAAPIGDGVQELTNVAPRDVGGTPLNDRGKVAPSAPLNRVGCA